MFVGILMFVIGMFFLFLFILRYMNEFEKEKPNQLEKFKKEATPALIIWSAIALIGLGIVAYHIFI